MRRNGGIFPVSAVAAAVLAVCTSPAHAQSCQEWRLRATSGPSPRGEFGLAYDSRRAMTVLVGGADNLAFNSVFRETWDSLITAKFATAVLLVTIAHACLSVYSLVLFWVLPMLRPGEGFDGPIPVAATLAVIAACAASSLFGVGIHTFISMRWANFALIAGIALGGILYALGVLDTRQARFIPWALPALVHKVAVPWILGLPGAPPGTRSLAVAIAISACGFVVITVAGGWLLLRRDVF